MNDNELQTMKKHIENAYRKFKDPANNLPSWEKFTQSLDGKEYPAAIIGKLNYQVENGGFSQWHFNGYSINTSDLLEILPVILTKFECNATRTVYKLIYEFSLILDKYEEFTYEDELCEDYDEETGNVYTYWDEVEVYNELEVDHLDSQYYAVNEAFLRTVNAWLSLNDDDFEDSISNPIRTQIARELEDEVRDPAFTDGKPRVKLVGQDSNVFNLLAIASNALRNAGQSDKIDQMQTEVTSADSFDAALAIITNYVDAY